MKKSLQIPVELIQNAVQKGTIPEFKVFIGAKMVSSGAFRAKGPEFFALCRFVGQEPRTINKHLHYLVQHDWLGHKESTQTYYDRSWEHFHYTKRFTSRKSVNFQERDMATFREFITGSLLTWQLEKYKYYCLKNEKKKKVFNIKLQEQQKGRLIRSVAYKSRATYQDASTAPTADYTFPEYFGFSNHRIAELLNCKYTQACNRKHEAEKAGYIATFQKFMVLEEFLKPDYNVRSWYYKGRGDTAKKYRFTTDIQHGKTVICFVQQLHDEIVSTMTLKRIPYFQNHKAKVKRARFLASSTSAQQNRGFFKVDNQHLSSFPFFDEKSCLSF